MRASRSKRTINTSDLAAFALTAFAALQPVVVAQPCEARHKVEGPHAVIEEVHNGKTFCVSHALIKAKPDEIWHILTDYNNAHRTFPMMKRCQVIEDHGSTKVMKHIVAPSGLPCTYEYVIELKETDKKSLEWKRISGSFKEVDGFWRLEPVEGGRHTMVTYASYVNGGLFIPQGMIKRQFRSDMPQVMATLTKTAEGNTQIASRRDSSATQQ